MIPNYKTIDIFDEKYSPLVKNIMLFESNEVDIKTSFKFSSVGSPSLIFYETPSWFNGRPQKEIMSQLFLHGQTIKPIEIEIEGICQVNVFELYPFTLKSLFNIEPKSINDDCHDLSLESIQIQAKLLTDLLHNKDLYSRVFMLKSYIEKLVDAKMEKIDHAIFLAIKRILAAKGNCTISNTAKEVHLTKRTFERRFLAETGLLPKQFAKIIQFQNSLTQLSLKKYTSLADVGYENGFADQSHFIKAFKYFTGQTPKQFVIK